ncbi:hypothetical protein JVU11DRAFT_6009 [Chiua virens]|nr:hypothetical protein JVU11DRAFT_6009 [Chiua virens]
MEPANVCVDHWRNAAPKAQDVYCLLEVWDFHLCLPPWISAYNLQSNTNMKYLLATISRLMDIFPDNFLYSDNIHCAFIKFLLCCSLRPTICTRGIYGVVLSFHGHAHNCLCQVQHHPKYKVSAGKEDFKTCEQVFSVSNAVTSQICNAINFHQHQVLEEHFKFANLDKYAALGTFLYNNYVQCLTIIDTAQAIPQSTEVADFDFDTELHEEREYLFNAHHTKSNDSVYIDYVKALSQLKNAECAWQDVLSDFNWLDFHIIHNGYTNKDIAEVRD